MNFLLDNLPSLAFVVGLGLLIAVLMRRIWAHQATRDASQGDPLAPTVPTPPLEPYRDPHRAALRPAELEAWQVEMHDLARELKGELDTKIVVLQRLIMMAQAESARLEKLLAALPDHAPEK